MCLCNYSPYGTYQFMLYCFFLGMLYVFCSALCATFKKEDQLWLLALICSRICHWFGGRIGLWAIFFSARHWIIATVLFSASHQIFLSVSLCHFLAISRQTSIFFMASYFKSFKTWGYYNHYRPPRIRLKSCENNLE